MTDPKAILAKYYAPDSRAYAILWQHSYDVAQYAVKLANSNPGLNADIAFIEEAALLHDIGIFLTDAPDLGCYGKHPYICHGYLGRELLEKEGLPKHALVCERHTGTGISLDEIIANNLPVPHREMVPLSIEEQLICFADKFFSKSRILTKQKTVDEIRSSLRKHGKQQADRFDQWYNLFL